MKKILIIPILSSLALFAAAEGTTTYNNTTTVEAKQQNTLNSKQNKTYTKNNLVISESPWIANTSGTSKTNEDGSVTMTRPNTSGYKFLFVRLSQTGRNGALSRDLIAGEKITVKIKAKSSSTKSYIYSKFLDAPVTRFTKENVYQDFIFETTVKSNISKYAWLGLFTTQTGDTITVKSIEILEGGTPPPNDNPPLTRAELDTLIQAWVENSSEENANRIINANTSKITDISHLFDTLDKNDVFKFDLDISGWDVSHVTNMSSLFGGVRDVNVDISDWDVSHVTDMSFMFSFAFWRLNISIQNWDVSSVTNMSSMFQYSIFNEDISSWDVSHVTDMDSMFQGFYGYSSFSVTNIFNSPLNTWDVSSVTNMSSMFKNSSYKQPLKNWDVSSVTNMSEMFSLSKFNQDINTWNVSKVTNMHGMFAGRFRSPTPFNQPLNNWDVSSVTDMSKMFYLARSFNQPLNNWDVSNVTDMSEMFYGGTNGGSFNQPLNNWNVSNVKNYIGFVGYMTVLSDENDPFVNIPTYANLNQWDNRSLTEQSTRVQATFYARPKAGHIDTVIGFSNGKANAYSDLGIIVRFAPNGTIDVRDGNTYRADRELSYTRDYPQYTLFSFRVVIDFTTKTYSVYVNSPYSYQGKILLAKDYAFRTEQSGLNSINNIAQYSIKDAVVNVRDVSFTDLENDNPPSTGDNLVISESPWIANTSGASKTNEDGSVTMTHPDTSGYKFLFVRLSQTGRSGALSRDLIAGEKITVKIKAKSSSTKSYIYSKFLDAPVTRFDKENEYQDFTFTTTVKENISKYAWLGLFTTKAGDTVTVKNIEILTN